MSRENGNGKILFLFQCIKRKARPVSLPRHSPFIASPPLPGTDNMFPGRAVHAFPGPAERLVEYRLRGIKSNAIFSGRL